MRFGRPPSPVALVDGNNHQIDRIEAEASRRKVSVAVVVDLIHVLEYLWGAVWCFFAEGDPAAEGWVRDRALAVLEGKARDVAAGVRRRATAAGLANQKRRKADECARYLTNKAPYPRLPDSNRKFAAVDSYVNFRMSKLASVEHATRGRLRVGRFNYGWLTGLGVYRLTGSIRRWSAVHV